MIGIFDSGVGGLSIFKEIKKMMPKTDIIYLADQANFPYGEKKKKNLLDIAIKNTQFLLEMGVSIIIVGCNTATVYVIEDLRKMFDVPFIGVVPAIKPASILSKNKRIGVLATKGTVFSGYLDDLGERLEIDSEIFSALGSSLIELVENNYDSIDEKILLQSISDLLEKNVDTIVLGCTHYHFLKDSFRQILPEITFLDSGEAIARQTKKIIDGKNLIPKDKTTDKFFTTGDVELFKNFINNVLGIKTDEIHGL